MSTIADKLALLGNTKKELKQALIEKEQNVTDATPFSQYPEYVRAISSDKLSKDWSLTPLIDSYWFFMSGWNCINYVGGRFVLTGTSNQFQKAKSPDGINWEYANTTETNSTLNASQILYFNNQYIALGEAYLYRSDDGLLWKRDATALLYQPYYFGVIADDTIVITNNGYNINRTARSIDGINWVYADTPNIPSRSYKFIAYGKDRLILVARSSTDYACYSIDKGISWVSFRLPIKAAWSGIVYGKDRFLIFSSSGNQMLLSLDGENWEIIELPFNSAYLFTFTGTHFIVVDSSYKSYKSKDGINWEEFGNLWQENWAGIAHGANKTILISNTNYVTAFISDSALEE